MTRYEGLNFPKNFREANFILNGNADTHVKESIPCNKTFQLGWGSYMFCTINGSLFTNFNVSVPKEQHNDSPSGSFEQVVTRGVYTCTAVAIQRGNLICLLHLDAGDITEKGSEIITNITVRLQEASGNISIIASRIDPDPEDHSGNSGTEQRFIQSLYYQCRSIADVNFLFINRGNNIANNKYIQSANSADAEIPAESRFFSHLEFGLCIGSKGDPLVFGDLVSSARTRCYVKQFSLEFSDDQQCVDNILNNATQENRSKENQSEEASEKLTIFSSGQQTIPTQSRCNIL